MTARRKKESQVKWAKSMLKSNGKVTRNEALKLGITRLSAIIWILRHEFEMEIDSKYVYKQGHVYDFEYFLKPEKA